MAFAKLDSLLKTEVYVRPENMDQNVAYPARKLTMNASRLNSAKSSALADLAQSETVSGAYYLPLKYLEHPAHKLTSRDVDEINEAISKKAKDVYIVHKGVTLGQHVVDLMYVNAGEPFRYKIYEGNE